jgi:hypothetical protein
MPYNDPIFYNYGTAASTALPPFIDDPDAPDSWWNPTVDVCVQEQYRDFTGVGSLSAFVGSILVFVGVQTLEYWLGRPLFNFPGLTPYRKDTGHDDAMDKDVAAEKAVELDDTAPGEEAHSSESKSYSAGVAKEGGDSSLEGTPEPAIEEGVAVAEDNVEESEHEA